MSSDAISWAFDRDIASTQKFVLVAIADHANPSGVCFPGQQRLSRMTGYEASTIVKAMKQLEAEGLIGRTERRRGDNMRTSDWIVLAPGQAAEERRPLKPPAEQEHYPGPVLALFGSHGSEQGDADKGSHGREQGESPRSEQGESYGSECGGHLDDVQGFKEEPPEGEPSDRTNPPVAPPQAGGQFQFRTGQPRREGFERRKRERTLPSTNTTDGLEAEWVRVLTRLGGLVDSSTFNLWLKPLSPVSTGETLTVAAPRQRSQWIRERFGEVLEAAAEKPVAIIEPQEQAA